MRAITELSLIIDNISVVLQYYIPGLLFISILCYLFYKNLSTTTKTLWSIVISYLAVAIVDLCFSPKQLYICVLMACSICVVASIAIGIVINLNFFQKIMVLLFHRTTTVDYWDDAIDFSNGSVVAVYPKNHNYCVVGAVGIISDPSEEQWIGIAHYEIYNKERTCVIDDEPSYLEYDNTVYHIRMADIDHIEVLDLS